MCTDVRFPKARFLPLLANSKGMFKRGYCNNEETPKRRCLRILALLTWCSWKPVYRILLTYARLWPDMTLSKMRTSHLMVSFIIYLHFQMRLKKYVNSSKHQLMQPENKLNMDQVSPLRQRVR